MTRRAMPLLLAALLAAACDDGNRATGLGPRGTALPPPPPVPDEAPAQQAPTQALRPARRS